MSAPLEPITLTGRFVRLEPLAHDHVDGLVAAASVDRSSYGYTWVPDGRVEMADYVDTLLAAHERAEVLPFAQRRLDTGEVVGCTRYLELRWFRGRADPDEVEIGGTWLSAPAQRTAINTEAKLLLLGHAFDVFGVWRVAICTDERNAASRAAIERLGATFEGVLRNHRLRYNAPEPTPRHSAMYSILPADWPAVRRALDRRLQQPA